VLWLKSNGNSTCDSVYFTTVNALFNCFISVHWTGCASCITNIVRIHHHTTFVEQRMMEGFLLEAMVTTVAIRCAKLQSDRHHQQTNCPSCCRTKCFRTLEGKKYHLPDVLTPSSPGGFPTLSLSIVLVSRLPVEGVAKPLISPLNTSTPRITKRTLYKLLRYRSPVPEHRA